MSASCSSAPATPPMSVELEPEPKKMVTLQSSDGELFKVELEVALLSRTIKNIVEGMDDCTSAPLHLPNVSSTELVRVLEFCRYHVEQHERGRPPAVPADGVDAAGRRQQISSSKKDNIEEWNAQFLSSLQLRPDVCALLLAARSLDIQSLVDLTCRRIADAIVEVGAASTAVKREKNWDLYWDLYR
ncbi:hypothetical protein L7F22_021298 [Adiantum nelumboides]|nr:hypothetical protein [Adiantum nelumboides]